MKWYTGDIAEAITYSKSKGAIFVVYIEGTDEKSQKITELIDNGELGKKLEQDSFVAIKLESGSTAHRQFSEIYKEPSVPSVYFIGKNGVPLDIITGNDNLDNVSTRVDKSLSDAGIYNPLLTSATASVLSDNFIKKEQASESSKVVCDNDVCEIVNDKGAEGESSNTDTKIKEEKEIKPEEPQELSSDEKVERAKLLIELKKQQQEKEDKENERLKELERRKMGQSVQQMKKWQEDQELKQLKEEREREKRENKEARDRVLAQIAQDKAERMSKSQPSPSAVPETSKRASQSPPKVSSNLTRLQFKLPDGSSNNHEFENTDTLDTVVAYIKNNLSLPFTNFTLSTVFPRREFTRNDYSQMLIDLQLCPTAVILILPKNNGTVSTNPGGTLMTLIWSLLAPILNIFDYFKRMVFGSNSNQQNPKRPSSDEPSESQRFAKRKRLNQVQS